MTSTAIPTTMNAVLLTGHGGPEMLDYRSDVAVPKPADDEVLIRVAAAGVNNTDINTRVGWYSKTGAADDAGWSATRSSVEMHRCSRRAGTSRSTL